MLTRLGVGDDEPFVELLGLATSQALGVLFPVDLLDGLQVFLLEVAEEVLVGEGPSAAVYFVDETVFDLAGLCEEVLLLLSPFADYLSQTHKIYKDTTNMILFSTFFALPFLADKRIFLTILIDTQPADPFFLIAVEFRLNNFILAQQGLQLLISGIFFLHEF